MSRTLKDQPFPIRFAEKIKEWDNEDFGGAKCRCSICGKNNGSRKNDSHGLYIRFGLGRNEDHRGLNGGKKYERKTLRTRLKRELRNEIEQNEIDNEQEFLDLLLFLDDYEL